MKETGWTDADRGRVSTSASSRAPNMRWVTIQQWHRDFSWSHSLTWPGPQFIYIFCQIPCNKLMIMTRASTWMTRRRVRASTAGAMEIGTRESGRRDSDMDMASMYGRIKMKSMTHDRHSISIGRQPIYPSKISFFRRLLSLHCFLSNTKKTALRTTHSTFHQKCIK